MKYQKLFTPVKVGSITIKNRFAMAPMGPLGLADANGGWNQQLFRIQIISQFSL